MKLVLGLGNTGLSIARFLSKQSINYRLADSRLTPPLLADFQAEFPDISPILGDWTQDLLTDIDEVFISPGIAQTQIIVIWARAKNIPVISDIALFARFAQAPIIAITGSNGKSTVTQLLGEMINNSGKKCTIGGNIGKPALDCLADDVEYYVLELSSYQLDYTPKISLLTGVVLNITPDHLERYDGFEDYSKSKLSLYNHCQHPVFNLDEKYAKNAKNTIGFSLNLPQNEHNFGTVVCHGTRYLIKDDEVLMEDNQLQLIGIHNISNVLAALALGVQIGLKITPMINYIKSFTGLPHRLEWIANKHGIDYYNDSKATNANASITAIKALIGKYQNISLIMGGIAKPEDYTELFHLINTHITQLILIGHSAKQFAPNIHQAKIAYAPSIPAAIHTATLTNPQAILLSPACASFDMFDNFEHRGRVFKECVEVL